MSDHRLANTYRHLWAQVGISPDLIGARGLPLYAQTDTLEVAETGSDGRIHQLTPAAAQAWRHMKAAAFAVDIDLHIVSAFRSVERQVELIATKLKTGAPLESVLEVLAPPGCSEHHTGRAIDLATGSIRPLNPDFADTDAFDWLQRSAGTFGFDLSFPEGNAYGYVYEPWHWCHRPSVRETT